MPDIDFIWGEIERLRVQVTRARLEILEHHRARLSSRAAQAPLARIDALCAAATDRTRISRIGDLKPDIIRSIEPVARYRPPAPSAVIAAGA